MDLEVWSVVLLLVLQWLVVRIILVVPIFGLQHDRLLETASARSVAGSRKLKLFVFLGSGGHTGEMLRLLENYQETLLRPGQTTLTVGVSDEASLARFRHTLGAYLDSQQIEVQVCRFGKAREVGASKLQSAKSVVQTLAGAMWTLTWLKWQFVGQPHLVLLNGPGTCCIIAGWLKLLEIVTTTRSKIVYVESLARTSTLSLSGKLLYPLVDEFVVQWSELCDKYGRARCFEILV
ncbi:LAME_0E02696g1_1 [Lachancea meyersii CBS 8951]|uniref:UDP-N-acetylglucosamine transferase subunit ALG14 n=1 Tax=Lachancea meyersii CBS 8951 TaxID=1266667 RepID=A0A1G4JG12_9SACH|nr:LAME_0E02696g1_1 [Lachancea meyersii CBS 8951]